MCIRDSFYIMSYSDEEDVYQYDDDISGDEVIENDFDSDREDDDEEDEVEAIPRPGVEVAIDNETILMERGIFPPPLKVETEVIDDITEADIPGEIKISKSGKLLRKYLTFEGFMADTIQAYDDAILRAIPLNLQSRQIKLPNRHVIRFTKIFYRRPTESEMTSLTARQQDKTYDAQVDANIQEYDENGIMIPDRQDRISLGRIPIMLGSVLDILRGKTEVERSRLGECIKDPMAYFVINGNEYLILLRDQLRLNRIF